MSKSLPARCDVVIIGGGIVGNSIAYHLGKIAFHEYGAIARDVRRAPGVRAKLGYLLAPPGWSHDGSTLTAGQLRAQVRRSA